MNRTNLLARTLMTVCASLWLSLSSTSLAQEAEAPTGQQAATGGFDIVIADGVLTHDGIEANLENVLDLLRERHPEVNIVVAPEVPKIRIENLKIRATDLPMELEALRVASGDQFTWGLGGGATINPVVDPMTGLPAQNSERPLYILRRAPEAAAGRLLVEAFSLGGYFETLPKTTNADENEGFIADKIEELQKMVDETVMLYRDFNEHMDGRDSSLKSSLNMRFHRGANLVILIGDPQSIEIAGKVIGALPHAQRSGGGMGQYDAFGRGYGAYGGAPGMVGATGDRAGESYGGGTPTAPATEPSPHR